MNEKSNLILEVKHLKKHFPLSKNLLGKTLTSLKAVDDVSFTLEKGKTIGVVGESGCGKTTLGRTILQLYDTTGGKTLYYGHTVYEFMPKYYLSALKKCRENINKFNDLNDCLDTINFNLDRSYSGYKLALNELVNRNVEHESDEEAKQIKDEIKVLNDVINLIENTAPYVGGLILSDKNVVDLFIKKLTLQNKIAKKNFNEDSFDELNLQLSNVLDEINRLKEPLKNNKGFIEYESMYETGLNLALLTKEEMCKLRTEIQLIFQDPYSSLPPRMTIGEILSEAVKVHNIVPKEEVSAHIRKIMKMCGLQPQYYDRYPHEFSGGQRQRICIARALAV
ncbi:MAG: ATP-binding cassette domain-containing protein, partial [Bacilli bacterium]|nr:ATP-binding cassette domain-containing protein [Bacilli bacterium]